jgi:DNA-directed RNA polymerase specialized sigma subunit
MIEKYMTNRSKLNSLLFYHNIRIVLNLAKKYVQKAESPADLLMNGARGLMIATEKFDINKNIKFNTYATRWVFKYIMMPFYSKSPITGVNQTSLNDLFYHAESNSEQIDYLCDNMSDMDEVSTALSGTGKGFLKTIDYTHYDRSSTSPSCIFEDNSNSEFVQDIISVISADPQFNDIDRDIIYNNMMDNNASINAIAQKYHVPSKDVNKRKRKLISEFKSMLAEKYNVNSLADII